MIPKLHFVNALPPVADAFATTTNSDVINVIGEGLLFVIQKGVGTTGTATITVEACDDVTPTTTAAVAFLYRTNTGTDVWSDWTRATTSGFTTTAGSNHLYQVYVEAAELAGEGTDGYGYARLVSTEVVDDPVLGGILAAIVNPRHAEADASMLD